MADPERAQHSWRNLPPSPFLCRYRNPNRKYHLLNAIKPIPANNLPLNDVTSIGYSYGLHGVTCYTQMLGKNVTLRQLKSVLIIKGNFRYFFKKASDEFGTGVVFEEVTEDSKVLPLWEGKAFCVLEPVHE